MKTNPTPTSDAAPVPEAIRLAAWMQEGAWHKITLGDVLATGRELRRLHAENQRLSTLKYTQADLDAAVAAELQQCILAVRASCPVLTESEDRIKYRAMKALQDRCSK